MPPPRGQLRCERRSVAGQIRVGPRGEGLPGEVDHEVPVVGRAARLLHGLAARESRTHYAGGGIDTLGAG